MDYFYFLLKDHIVGPRRLDIINQYGVKAGISDYAALLHCGASDMVNPRLGSCAGWWWTMSPCADNVYMVFDSGNVDYCPTDVDNRGIRPAIKYSKVIVLIKKLMILEFLKFVMVNILKQLLIHKPLLSLKNYFNLAIYLKQERVIQREGIAKEVLVFLLIESFLMNKLRNLS